MTLQLDSRAKNVNSRVDRPVGRVSLDELSPPSGSPAVNTLSDELLHKRLVRIESALAVCIRLLREQENKRNERRLGYMAGYAAAKRQVQEKNQGD